MDTLKKSTAAEIDPANITPAPAPTTPADPFADLSKLRLNQNFVELAGAKKLLTTVPVRKPHKQAFVWVHPSEEYRDAFAFIELQEDDRDHYLVMPDVAVAITPEIVMKTLFTTIDRQGVVSLWPVPLPPADGSKYNEWHRSAREGAESAMVYWHRITANKAIGANEITEAPPGLPPPVWPEYTFKELLRVGFRDRLIQSLDHPVLKRLRGEM